MVYLTIRYVTLISSNGISFDVTLIFVNKNHVLLNKIELIWENQFLSTITKVPLTESLVGVQIKLNFCKPKNKVYINKKFTFG